MGTGVTSSLSSPNIFNLRIVPSKLDNKHSYSTVIVQLQCPATSELRPPPYDKSTSNRYRSSCFLYLSRCASVLTSLDGHFRFSFWLSPRSISIRQLHMSPCFHLEPIYLIISEGSYLLKVMGNLILRGASCLDAFSTYPVHT